MAGNLLGKGMYTVLKQIDACVLFVDDTPEVLLSYRMALESQAIEVSTSLNGFDGFRQAVLKRFNLIVVDAQMPIIDGFELCRRLKADLRSVATPVMFITGSPNHADEIRAINLGAVAYLSKPIELDTLQKAVAKWAIPY